jgi:hypothetical protein
MATSIHVEASRPADAADLADFLEARGLSVEVAPSDDHWEIDVEYALNEEDRLRADVWDALRSWLAERESPLVPVATDERYVLRPPGE